MKKVLTLCLFFASIACADAKSLKIVASLKPIHGLVEAVMGEAGTPELLISEAVSPHHFSFTPSQAAMIDKADLIFWVGPELENVLQKPLAKKDNGSVVALMDIDDLVLHTYENDVRDPHIWLSPENAVKMVEAIRDQLSSIDPDQAEIYKENAEKLILEISLLDRDLKDRLAPYKNKVVFVYHDGYHYFESHFGLQPSIPILNDAEHHLKAKRRLELEKIASQKDIACVFGEPNHGTKTVASIAAQLNLRQGLLDPLGANLSGDEKNSYLAILENLAQTYISCIQD